jgi:sec-independent protein translocase protein TatB
MFGIGMQEIVLICVIALIVVGPKKLPEIARALGKGYGEFRRTFDEMKRNVETEFDTDEIRRSLRDLQAPPPPPAAPPPPAETLLTAQPAPYPGGAPDPYRSPYPELMDGAPPPPETPDATAPGAPRPEDQHHG